MYAFSGYSKGDELAETPKRNVHRELLLRLGVQISHSAVSFYKHISFFT